MRRHKTAGYVVDIICSGDVLPLELVAPSFDKNDAKAGLIPKDGQIIRDRFYEQLKRARLKTKGEPGAPPDAALPHR